MSRKEVRPSQVSLGTPDTERQLVAVVPVSGMPWQQAQEVFVFPEMLAGLRVLDIGAGASEVTATLLEQGADAYALDPRYNSRPDLKGRARVQIEHVRSHGAVAAESYRQHVAALDHCMESIKENPTRYKAGYASSLPFADGEFDLVLSAGAILGYLDMDSPLLLQATQEAIRVTKQGGTVQMFPFEVMDPGFGDQVMRQRMQNHEKWEQWLRGNPEVTYYVEPGWKSAGLLVITKQ